MKIYNRKAFEGHVSIVILLDPKREKKKQKPRFSLKRAHRPASLMAVKINVQNHFEHFIFDSLDEH